jgi:chorismate synthase
MYLCLLSMCMVMQVLAYVSDVMEVGSNVDQANFTMEDVESNIVRCPDQDAAQKMIDGERGGGEMQQQQQ